MKLLVSLKAKDVDSSAPDLNYDSFKPRVAVRAVVFDDNKKIAVIHVAEHDYYMLPGGGLDEGEDPTDGLIREMNEELGCTIEIADEVGSAEVYFDRWSKKQTDYCYIAHVVGSYSGKSLTDFEIEEGHNVIWANDIETAVNLVAKANPKNLDGKLVRARDLAFLKAALQAQ